ncbi:MAG: 2-phospho-L-lactate guanylyltransferase [Ilumatobacteraceae bacterium]
MPAPAAAAIRVLVPIKSFSRAKARLAGVLTPAQRVGLARHTAQTVVAAAGSIPVHVVCDDREVATWAEAAGADVIWSPGTGLDGAVRNGVAALGTLGAAHVIVAHGDLPCARTFDGVCTPGAVTLVPDLAGDGTNVASVPVDSDFPFAYGRRSFDRHQRLALDTGLPLVVRRDLLLALDIDTPDDLCHPLVQEALPEWLRPTPPTTQANPQRAQQPR